ncbi:MAG: transglutaminase [Pirellulaceae bacterium]|nr:MAG: transglutaminase [Pirellulaceae bacterium]
MNIASVNRRRCITTLSLGMAAAVIRGTVRGQAEVAPGEETPTFIQYTSPKTFPMHIGVRIVAGDGAMVRTKAMTVFPTNWPEQRVEIVAANVPPPLNYEIRELPGGNRQLVFTALQIPPYSQLEALLQVSVQKWHVTGPEDPTTLVAPRRIERELRNYLGNSPYIEADCTEIRNVAREIQAENALTDWNKVELVYDWVRENITYEQGELKTVRQAMRDRAGDCEEMTSIFVAICRALRIPARMVWVPNHCYPEFYLESPDGSGYWFPCQVAGTRSFGSMPDYLPILQKGDRFKIPEKPKLERYLADYLAAQTVGGRQEPQVQFVRELLGDLAQTPPPDLNGMANP